MKDADTLMNNAYIQAMEKLADANRLQSCLDKEHSEAIDTIVSESERNKVEKTKVKRYYILSTKNPAEVDLPEIQKTVRQLKNIHGCQLVVNGVNPTLKYYLRLLEDTTIFIDCYTRLLSSDKAILFEHKEEWNNLVSSL